ncbi:MAG: primosomal protein N' [Saprospiraceae bacterium]
MTDTPKNNYVTVILPLAVPKTYTYQVPSEMRKDVDFGIRVEVPLRNKLYSGIIVELHEEINLEYKTKYILSVIDDEPIIHYYQYEFWQWMADYYCCTIGEVMHVALPGGLRLSSETRLLLHDDFQDDFSNLTDNEYIVAEALSIRNELTIEEVKDLLNKKTVYPLIRSLIDKNIVTLKEKLLPKYKPKMVGFIRLMPTYEDQTKLAPAFELIKRSDHQTNALLAYVSLSRGSNEVPRSAIYELSGASIGALRALEKKGIVDLYDKEVSRLVYEAASSELPTLSTEQINALSNIDGFFKEKKICLLHGVTGSGKTRVYMELIKNAISEGKQILYLLPEIALTTQIVSRLQLVFGEDVVVFHSRMNNNERVELWKDALIGKKIILGARSSLFLPFSNLGLIIVDEEHDPSYKQNDPAPRYNARDCAVYLAQKLEAKIILGTATPSIESYDNAIENRYGLVELTERHGKVAMPDIEIVDLKKAQKTGKVNGYFSLRLIEVINTALVNKEQVLLFQNRRGYAPSLQCTICGWKGECQNCDVTLTYHKFFDELKCHYCGYRNKNPRQCPGCGNDVLEEVGVGTERIQDDIRKIFPDVVVKRMDYDTVRTKNAYTRILEDFGSREIDILVGTQMITKGLDFDNIGVVGVLNADNSLRFPDFRAGERTFQLLTQVAGRAGRRKKQGKVVIQTYSPSHPVIMEIMNNNFQRMYQRESIERKRFVYPPYFRMIFIQLKHKKPRVVEDAARYMAHQLREQLGNRVVGPAQPGVARVKSFYLQNIIIKIEKKAKMISYIKSLILHQRTVLKTSDGFKSVLMKIDVDPY